MTLEAEESSKIRLSFSGYDYKEENISHDTIYQLSSIIRHEFLEEGRENMFMYFLRKYYFSTQILTQIGAFLF